jgi:8-oxo-dGTP pyrophosphatase MutT (NUDIX family)
VRVALGLLATILLTTGINLPHGEWASVTMLVVIGGLQHHGNIGKKAAERATGTLIGAGVGLLLVAQQAWLGLPWLTYFAMAVVCGFFSYHAIGKGGYTALLSAITVFIVAGHGDNPITDGLWRGVDILIGIALALAFSFALPLYAVYSWRYNLADALRDAGRSGPWRNEQLAVQAVDGSRIGTVERGAVRVLGIATLAVHLVGVAPDGRLWVQQRAANKANYPLHWDTLMGGMVSAQDSLEQALARETWEEAGLQIDDLQGLRHGGVLRFRQPDSDGGDDLGYMYEDIHWYAATVPEGTEPHNQDGEVAQFALWQAGEVQQQLAQARFTPEAALVWAGFADWTT